MGSPTVEGALLLLLFLLLPFQLLSLRSRVLRGPSDKRSARIRSMILVSSAPILLSAIFVVSDLESPPRFDDSVSRLEEMKLRIAHLESILEENTEALNSKILRVEENNKLIEEMEHKMQILQTELHSIKASPSGLRYSEERVNALDEEVRLLWAMSRKKNFDAHILESKADNVEVKLEAVVSEAEKMENIVTEQWIQIRQLEQSFQMMKIMTSKVHKKSTTKVPNKQQQTESKILKSMKAICCHYFPEIVDFPNSFLLGGSISSSWISRVFDLLRNLISGFKKWHYELQDSVKLAMETNEFAAALAHEEVVFFLASAIFTLPVMGTWVLCSLWFSDAEPE